MSSDSGPIVVIVGPLGSGRTSVGKAIANVLGAELSETEDMLEEKWGVPFSRGITSIGWEEFTEDAREAALSQLLSSRPFRVVTLLPITLSFPAVKHNLADLGRVAQLMVPVGELAKRVGLDKPRNVGLGQPRALFSQMVQELSDECAPLEPFVVDNAQQEAQMTAIEIVEHFALQ